jgi:TolA-binding protein
MQATLADSALYVRQLRRRISELEVWQQQQQQQQRHQQQQQYQTLKQGAGGDGRQDKDQGAAIANYNSKQ